MTTPTTTLTEHRKFRALPPAQQHMLFQLHQMGFRSEGRCRHALSKTDWHVENAVLLLLDCNNALDDAFDEVPHLIYYHPEHAEPQERQSHLNEQDDEEDLPLDDSLPLGRRELWKDGAVLDAIPPPPAYSLIDPSYVGSAA
ncbi:hypothetical protein HKX48_004069 [Thoreauomyces humboldtii]|nr:hypothetical protein HKX48_004069 [Thoreauomyces humboldtii]